MARLAIPANREDAMRPHDSGDSFASDPLARFPEVKEDPRTAVDPAAGLVRLADHAE